MSEKFAHTIDAGADDPQARVETAWNLPPSWYTTQEVFDLENEKIFRTGWHYVGHVGQLPQGGDRFSTELFGEPVLVVRGRDDVIRAFANVCRHRGHRVDIQCKRASMIRCPYHGWAYDLEGQCRKAKGMDGAEDFDPAEFSLHSFHCEVLGPWIFVALEDPAPFDEVFSPVIEYATDRHFALDLEYRGGRKWEAPINWKTFTDNFDESYHIPFIHAYSLEQIIDWQDEWKSKWGVTYYGREPYPRGPGARMAGAIGGVGDFRRLKPAISGLDERDQTGYTIFWIWPLTILFFMPDGMIAINLVPGAPDRLSDTWHWWLPRAEDTKEKVLQGLLMHMGHIVNEEDTEAMVGVQAGLSSRHAQRGRYAPALEDSLHHAHAILRSHLGPFIGESPPPAAVGANGHGNGARSSGHVANGTAP